MGNYRFEPRLLRIDLSTGKITSEKKDAQWARKYMGGMGYGTRILWEELDGPTAWNSPDNKLVFSLGPLTGTTVTGSGLCCVNTVGAMTNGLCSAQYLGHWGACLRKAGYSILVIEGVSEDWKYLYISEDGAELRDASAYRGLDTWDTEDAIKEDLELANRASSVCCIGPAGENLVRFAGIFCDKGHVASSNGPGAVMGYKKLKAIAIRRLDNDTEVFDPEKLDTDRREFFESANTKTASGISKTSGTRYVGTLGSVNMMNMAHLLPVKNYLSTDFPTVASFNKDAYERDPRVRFTRTACWACPWNHCSKIEVTEGKYKGLIVDEPEYEGISAASALIGNFDDTIGALAINSEVDRLGFDMKETGFLVAMVMELYEKGIVTEEDLGGMSMHWGDVEGVLKLLRMIAYREGFGNILAEGVKRSAEKIGHGAEDIGVYTRQGFAPHIHDQRSQWSRIPGFGMSDYGSNLMNPVEGFTDKDNFGIEKPATPFNVDEIAEHYVMIACHRPVDDATGVCMFYTQADWRTLIPLMNDVTGWDMDVEEAKEFGFRMVSLMRAFNYRNGMRAKDYGVSKRWMVSPTEGEWKQAKIIDEETMQRLFSLIAEGLGWDPVEACPTPETLRRLGLEDCADVIATISPEDVDRKVREA